MRPSGMSHWVLAAVITVWGVGCSIPPPATTSHVFPCNSDADCLQDQGFVCRNQLCVHADGATDGGITGNDGGTTGNDGGTTGNDGGTTGNDGGVASCDTRLAVDPPTIDGTTPSAIRIFVPNAGTSEVADVTIAGQAATGVAPLPAVGNMSYGVSAVTPASLPKGQQDVVVDLVGGGCLTAKVHVVTGSDGSVTIRGGGGVTAGDRVTLEVAGLSKALSASDEVEVWMAANGAAATRMTDVEVLDGTTLRASIPPNTPMGPRRVIVTDAIQIASSSPGALTVSDPPGPVITDVSPIHLPIISGSSPPPLNKPVTLQLTGDHLQAQAKVWLSCGIGSPPSVGDPATLSAGGQGVSVTVPMPDLTDPEPCTLFYQAPGTGGAMAHFAGLVAYVDGSAVEHNWIPSGVSMTVKRNDAGAAVATLADGTRYLVVVGGAATTGDPLRTSDVLRLGDDGEPMSDTLGGSLLPQGLTGPAVAARGPVIYVAGGAMSGGSPSKQVLRAQVLGEGDRVKGFDAELDVGQSGYGATVGPQVLYYAVTAHYPVDSAHPPLGETPATAPLRVVIPPGVAANVILHWHAAPNAPTSYQVYRGTTPDDLHSLPLGSGGPQTGTVFVDDNSASAGVGPASKPPEVGTLSEWQTDGSWSLPSAAIAPAMVVASGELVAAGGQYPSSTSAPAFLSGIQVAGLGAHPGAPVGSFGAPTGTPTLARARSFFDARVVTKDWSPATASASLPENVLFGPGSAGSSSYAVGDAWELGTASTSDLGSTAEYLDNTHLFVGANYLEVVGYVSGPSQANLMAPLTINTSSSPAIISVGNWGGGTGSLPYEATGRASAESRGFCYLAGGANQYTNVAWTIR